MVEIERYIKNLWHKLTRTTEDVSALVSEHKYGAKNYLFVSPQEDFEKISKEFLNKIEIKKLPKNVRSILDEEEQGLLYLPKPYVVPGGRFNEMYGWDSHFIILGLLLSDEIELARDMIENQLYQIEYYGKILNANRTYYISRSQPPLIAASIIAYYEKTGDKILLKKSFPLLEKYYQYFRTSDKYLKAINLSRYWDESSSPAYELRGEDEKGYYNNLKELFRLKKISSKYPLSTFYDEKTDSLTEDFYRSDRSMRESGFDITDMFGEFSCETIFKAPVCLNSLLCKMAQDISKICEIVDDKENVKKYFAEYEGLKNSINQYLWSEKLSGYFNYDINFKENDDYLYATIFYPLWAGVATKEQAEMVIQTALPLLTSKGLLTSSKKTGKQWDAPFAWAPLNYFAVHGMMKYGFYEEARNVRLAFMKTIEQDFVETKSLKEKYDLEKGTSSSKIEFGYNSNEEGFGWTNAVYLDFLRLNNL